MTITIQPFNIEVYEEVLALWQKCEGVGLSGADSREEYSPLSGAEPRPEFCGFSGRPDYRDGSGRS